MRDWKRRALPDKSEPETSAAIFRMVHPMFATGSDLLWLGENRSSMRVFSNCAWLCRSSQQAICMPARLLGQIRDEPAELLGNGMRSFCADFAAGFDRNLIRG